MLRSVLVPLCLVVLARVAGAETTTWPQFRGPGADGLAEGRDLPDRWSPTENVVWKTDLPGKGWSSPIVWGERICVTAAVPAEGGKQRWMLYCLDWNSGKIVWERQVFEGKPSPVHQKNSYASETPVTDGERVYVYFGNVGLVHCYDFDGTRIWEKDLGRYRSYNDYGTGSSPLLHRDRLYVLNDNLEQSFLIALDRKTGEQVWKTAREERTNWGTPTIWENSKRTEIVVSAINKVRSYDLDGKVLWELKGQVNAIPRPLAKGDLVYFMFGFFSQRKSLYAVRAGGSGDLSLKDGETSSAAVAWHQPKGGAYHPSPLALGERLYALGDNNVLSCFDARTGKPFYENQRLPNVAGLTSASPWAYDGKVFFLSESGIVTVIADGPEFKVLHQNRMEETCMATPAIARGSLLLRTESKLYRIGNKK
jgi:outer membrane protein assembly factor BamB